MAQVFTVSNLAIAAAPPTYHLPNDAGVPIPAGQTKYDLAIDLGGTVPPAQNLGVMVEYLVSGTWQDDAGGTMTTGSYTPKSGVPTTVNHITSSIGSHDSNGALIGPYPTAARVRVNQAGAWTLPNITLTLS